MMISLREEEKNVVACLPSSLISSSSSIPSLNFLSNASLLRVRSSISTQKSSSIATMTVDDGEPVFAQEQNSWFFF
jgi:hypothetical protein